METTTVTETQIKALVVIVDVVKELAMNTRNHIDAQALQDVIELQHKLELANDGKLRLSGRFRTIDIKHDGDCDRE